MAASKPAADSEFWSFLADFRARLKYVLIEFGVKGRNVDRMVEAVCGLLIDCVDRARYEQALADVKRAFSAAQERQKAGKAGNAVGLAIRIVDDYVRAGGQLHLFGASPARPVRPVKAGRRPQVAYTAEQREAVEAKAAEALAARASGDDEALRAQIERAEASAQAAQTADRRTYWTDYAARLRVRLGEVATS